MVMMRMAVEGYSGEALYVPFSSLGLELFARVRIAFCII